jgi:O-antigen/teichoic acid export membrane protein
MNNVIHVGISISRKTEYSPLIFVSAAIVNLVLNLLMIPRWGIMGAAMATVGATMFMVFLKYIIVKNIYYIKYEWGRIIKIFLVTICLFWLSKVIIVKEIWAMVLIKGSLVLIFPVLLYFMRFYQKAEIETIVSFIRKK